MKLITKQGKANTVAERWKQTYYSYNYSHELKEWYRGGKNNSEDKYNKLIALGDNPSPKSIESIIGNPTWTTLTCDHCKKEVDKVVSFSGVASDEYGYTELCWNCIDKISNILKS